MTGWRKVLRTASLGLCFIAASAPVHSEEHSRRAEVVQAQVVSASGMAAMAVLDAYLEAFNERDDAAFDATFNFPTYRLAANQLAVQQRGQTDFGAFAGTKPNWSYSAWTQRSIIQSGSDKVHIAATLARYRADGSLVESFDSLYVITEQNRTGIGASRSGPAMPQSDDLYPSATSGQTSVDQATDIPAQDYLGPHR